VAVGAFVGVSVAAAVGAGVWVATAAVAAIIWNAAPAVTPAASAPTAWLPTVAVAGTVKDKVKEPLGEVTPVGIPEVDPSHVTTTEVRFGKKLPEMVTDEPPTPPVGFIVRPGGCWAEAPPAIVPSISAPMIPAKNRRKAGFVFIDTALELLLW